MENLPAAAASCPRESRQDNYLFTESLTGAVEVVTSLNNSFYDAHFTLLEVGSGVIELLNADFAVNLEHTVIVLEHMVNDGTGESVLSIGVDVHLNYTVLEGLFDISLFRAGAAG